MRKKLAILLVIPLMIGSGFYIYAVSAHGGAPDPCTSNLKQLGTATLIYMSDNDRGLPLGKWSSGLDPFLIGVHCPRTPRMGYAMNKTLPGADTAKINHRYDVVMFFETDELVSDAVGDIQVRSARHSGGSNLIFLDSHISWLPKSAVLPLFRSDFPLDMKGVER